MPLESPNLDDRSWRQLVDSAIARIRQDAPDWSDLTPGDPGVVLVEVFAYLTEALIYRLNRVPDKLFIEFLRLTGVRLQPPAAAAVTLRFSREEGVFGPIEIPRGTHVTVARPVGGSEPPVFVTAETATMSATDDEAMVRAYHADLIEAESLGVATGNPGLMRTVQRPPIVAPTGDPLDLIVAVEAAPGELKDGDPATEHDGKTYRVWRAVENFTHLGADLFVYMVDRAAGTIMFAPAARTRVDENGEILDDTSEALAAIPPRGRDIRVWYRRGGGPDGNVAAGVLTAIREPIKAVVDNPEPATGGRAAETLENALVRGPQELHTLSRAVTARDFELAAERASGAVSRAKAVTQAALWAYATPGAVEVFLVPSLTGESAPEGAEPDEAAIRAVTVEQLVGLETPLALERVREELDERRPLGTTCLVDWVRYKNVHVSAEIVIHREEDQAEVQRRVDDRLHATINPLPTRLNAGGWPFGQSLYASSVYKIILSEPGVRYARGVQLIVDDVPNEAVKTLAADPFQDGCWYAGAGSVLFRSLNDGNGWEAMTRFEGETITRIESHPEHPGMVAVVTLLAERSSRVSVSMDSGATWAAGDPTAVRIEDIAWMDRDNKPIVLLATDVGLYSLDITPGADPVPLLVDESDQDMGFYAVAVAREIRGELTVAVAAREVRGVYLSSAGAAPRTFRKIGLENHDVRALAVQVDGPDRYLWAGVATSGDNEGEGAHSWHLEGDENPRDGWRARGQGWTGGSCFNLAFLGSVAFASSHHSGVLWLDASLPNGSWQKPGVGSNLPQRDIGRFQPVDTVAAAGSEDKGVVMAGGIEGVRRSFDGGVKYDDPSRREFDEEVTIPPTWLMVNGQNTINVKASDE
jgi:hypothetical protein